MKYELQFSEEVDRRLSQKATETGQDAVQLIQLAVDRFVNDDDVDSAYGAWSPEVEVRRRILIDKDIAGTLTTNEQMELSRLDRLANEHFDRIAPPPIEGAQRIHEQLLQKRDRRQ